MRVLQQGGMHLASVRRSQGHHALALERIPKEFRPSTRLVAMVAELPIESDAIGPESLRFRMVLQDRSDQESLARLDGEEHHGGNETADSLKWFGFFSSTALKLAQLQFKNALEQVVEIANLQMHLPKMSHIDERGAVLPS